LIGLTDAYLSYCLDEVIYIWGTYVENQIDEAGDKGKKPEDRQQNRNKRLGELLDLPVEKRYKSFRQGR